MEDLEDDQAAFFAMIPRDQLPDAFKSKPIPFEERYSNFALLVPQGDGKFIKIESKEEK